MHFFVYAVSLPIVFFVGYFIGTTLEWRNSRSFVFRSIAEMAIGLRIALRQMIEEGEMTAEQSDRLIALWSPVVLSEEEPFIHCACGNYHLDSQDDHLESGGIIHSINQCDTR